VRIVGRPYTHPEEAIEAMNHSIRMSPRDPFNYTYLRFAAIAHFAVEGYAEAIACEEKVPRERPKVSPARFVFLPPVMPASGTWTKRATRSPRCYVYRQKARSMVRSPMLVRATESGMPRLCARRDCPRDRIRKLDRRDESSLTPALDRGIQAEYERGNNHAPIVHARTNRG